MCHQNECRAIRNRLVYLVLLLTYYLTKYNSSLFLCLGPRNYDGLLDEERDLLSIIFFERGPIIRGPNEGEGDSSM